MGQRTIEQNISVILNSGCEKPTVGGDSTAKTKRSSRSNYHGISNSEATSEEELHRAAGNSWATRETVSDEEGPCYCTRRADLCGCAIVHCHNVGAGRYGGRRSRGSCPIGEQHGPCKPIIIPCAIRPNPGRSLGLHRHRTN